MTAAMQCASALLLALTVALLLPQAAAVCSSTSCGDCSEDQCSNTPGCFDDSPGDYDPNHCIECSEGECGGTGGDNMALDPSLGCTAEDNIIASAIMGLLGGAFACVLPCCGLCFQAQKQWAEDFLSAPEDRVRRAQATIKEKWVVHSNNNNTNSTSYMFEIEFESRRRSGAAYKVCAKVAVQSATYSKYEKGSQVEVAYVVDDERDFVLTEDVGARVQGAPVKLLGCIFCCFAVVGLAVGAGAWPLTGCFVGIVPLLTLIVGGAVAGRCCMFQLTRKLTQSGFYVTVTPCDRGVSPGAMPIGATAAEV